VFSSKKNLWAVSCANFTVADDMEMDYTFSKSKKKKEMDYKEQEQRIGAASNSLDMLCFCSSSACPLSSSFGVSSHISLIPLPCTSPPLSLVSATAEHYLHYLSVVF
jgi:hypothetical protein